MNRPFMWWSCKCSQQLSWVEILSLSAPQTSFSTVGSYCHVFRLGLWVLGRASLSFCPILSLWQSLQVWPQHEVSVNAVAPPLTIGSRLSLGTRLIIEGGRQVSIVFVQLQSGANSVYLGLGLGAFSAFLAVPSRGHSCLLPCPQCVLGSSLWKPIEKGLQMRANSPCAWGLQLF